ncbi:MAG: site-specific integrase [Proteobacteria bacterium]|nr:site-specific integrase [Pseudomonadota bacterium]MBU1596756.1 site-specific integrase [Pseudomonadota bacterium]
MAALTDVQIQGLADKYLRAELEAWETRRATSREPYTPEYVEQHPAILGQLQAMVKDKLALNDLGWIAPTADKLLATEGLSVSKDSADYGKLCRALLIASGKWAEIEQRRAQGDYTGEAELFPRPVVPAQPLAQAASVPPVVPAPPKKAGPLLSEALKKYEADKRANSEWKGRRTARTVMDHLAQFVELVGDIPTDQLTAERLADFKADLRRLPASRKTSPKYRDKTLERLLTMEIPEEDRYAPDTVSNLFSRIRSFLSWMKTYGLIADASIKDVLAIRVPKKKPEDKRAPFTPADLKAIFHSRGYLEDSFTIPWKFWVPVLGMFTGARLEEICQLRLEHIKQVDGIWCLDITETLDATGEVDTSVKTEAGIRMVPLHPFLVDGLHFPAYVKSLKRQGHERLFPMLKKTRETNFTYSHPVSKWFGLHLKKLGLGTTPGEGKKVFHSFRHTLIHTARTLGIPDPLIAETVGHEYSGPIQQNYIHGRERMRYEGLILKLDFGVDLEHLKGSRWVLEP